MKNNIIERTRKGVATSQLRRFSLIRIVPDRVLHPARVIYERTELYENRIEFKTVEQPVFSERKIESIESFEAFRRGIRRAPLPLHRSDDLQVAKNLQRDDRKS